MAEHPAGHLVLKWLIEQDSKLKASERKGKGVASLNFCCDRFSLGNSDELGKKTIKTSHSSFDIRMGAYILIVTLLCIGFVCVCVFVCAQSVSPRSSWRRWG